MNTTLRALSQDWWIFLLEGVVAIVIGLIVLFWPGPTLHVIIVLFGLFALLSGVVEVFAAIGAADNHQPWGWKLTRALLGILVGLAILRWPGASVLFVLYLVGFWLILGGIVGIVEAFAEHREVQHVWLLLLASAVSLLFGIAMFAWPKVAVVTVVYLVGIYAIVQGLVLCVLAFQVRSHPERLLSSSETAPGALPST
jgi:uncharacterized membrane protein HdeD (DUF308 family)